MITNLEDGRKNRLINFYIEIPYVLLRLNHKLLRASEYILMVITLKCVI